MSIGLAAAMLTGCGGSKSAGERAQSPSSPTPAEHAGASIDQLEGLQAQLSAAVTEVTRPLDQSHAVFDQLERVLTKHAETLDRDTLIRAIVSVVNTGAIDPQVKAALLAPPQPPVAPVPAEESSQPSAPGTGVPPTAPTTAANPTPVDGPAPLPQAPLPPSTMLGPSPEEAIADLLEVGLQLRELISSLKATPQRAAAVGAAATNLIAELPVLAADATVSAQLELNNPLASAEAQAEAQRTIERIQVMVQALMAQASEIQKQVVTLPGRSQQLIAKAQQLLKGAALTPPKDKGPSPVITALAATLPQKKRTPLASASVDKPAARPEAESYQWGWWVASGASAAVMGAGIVVFVTADSNASNCEVAASGCSNYYDLKRDERTGVALVAAGATGTVAMGVTALIVNSGPSRETASVACSPSLGGIACSGRF